MRMAIIAMLLCGCAWEQDNPHWLYAYCGGEPCPKTKTMWCDDGVVRYGPIPKGKTDFGSTPCKVPQEPKPMDVPATMVDYVTHKAGEGYGENGMWFTPKTDQHGRREGCTDPDRILIGPDGHSKYWCHLPQQ
jgi:hypothetical protein